MLFVRGSGNCVQCDTPLRKSNFRVQLFEDPAIDKEVEIRKKVLKMYVAEKRVYMCIQNCLSGQVLYLNAFLTFFSYNKREFDFSILKEYNDYLEKVEDIGDIHIIIYLFIMF